MTGPLSLRITFHPPDKRRRDRDNMIAAFKAGQDGLSDSLGVDDSQFVTSYAVGDVIKGGSVVVEVRPATQEVPFCGTINERKTK